jgi:hypothetical protein
VLVGECGQYFRARARRWLYAKGYRIIKRPLKIRDSKGTCERCIAQLQVCLEQKSVMDNGDLSPYGMAMGSEGKREQQDGWGREGIWAAGTGERGSRATTSLTWHGPGGPGGMGVLGHDREITLLTYGHRGSSAHDGS